MNKKIPVSILKRVNIFNCYFVTGSAVLIGGVAEAGAATVPNIFRRVVVFVMFSCLGDASY